MMFDEPKLLSGSNQNAAGELAHNEALMLALGPCSSGGIVIASSLGYGETDDH